MPYGYYRLCGALHQSTYRGVMFIAKCTRYAGHEKSSKNTRHFDERRRFGWRVENAHDTSED